MAPSAVNNVIRQQMADHRAQWNDAEWFNYGDGEGGVTLTYVSADQFKVEGVDVTTAYHVGRRVRVVGTGTGTIYGTINAVAFSIDTTVTVTFDSGSLSNETLTVSLGIISARNEAMKLDAQRLVKGVIEANANFVDFVVFGPALDPVKDWHKRLGVRRRHRPHAGDGGGHWRRHRSQRVGPDRCGAGQRHAARHRDDNGGGHADLDCGGYGLSDYRL